MDATPATRLEMDSTNPPSLDSDTWTIEEIRSGVNISSAISFTLDSDNHPHLVYSVGNGASLIYETNAGGEWMREEVDGHAKSFSGALRVDSNNQPRVAYCAFGCPTAFCFCSQLMYATREGGSWQSTSLDSGSSFMGNGAALDLDTNDHPHIAYYSASSVVYTYFNGSSWSKSTVGQFGLEHWAVPSIGLDGKNQPHIAYGNPNVEVGDIQYGYLDEGKWVMESIGKGLSAVLEMDDHDEPHILACDNIGWRHLKYFHGAEGIWNTDILYEHESFCMGGLAVNSSGFPHIVYADRDAAVLFYTYFDGAAWRKVVVHNGPVIGAGISLDKDDKPHVIFVLNQPGSIFYATMRK